MVSGCWAGKEKENYCESTRKLSLLVDHLGAHSAHCALSDLPFFVGTRVSLSGLRRLAVGLFMLI